LFLASLASLLIPGMSLFTIIGISTIKCVIVYLELEFVVVDFHCFVTATSFSTIGMNTA